MSSINFFPVIGYPGGHLDPVAVGVALAFLVALGLRDKVPFLAARAEVYGNLMIVFLFPLGNMIIACQLIFIAIWWGAASSKLNHHFPFVVTVMISNTPWNRWRAAKRRLYRDHPEDLLPSSTGALAAHLGTVIEFTLPLILLVSAGGTIGTIAVAGMIIFHLHILSTFPLAVPLEWNIFMIFGLLFLFGHYGATSFSTLDEPAPDRDPRGHLRRLPDPRQPPSRPRLVPALDALLRRQLGDEPVAVPARGREAPRRRDRQVGADRHRSSSPSSTRRT